MRPAALFSALLYVVTEVGSIIPPRGSLCCSGMSEHCFYCAEQVGRWRMNQKTGVGEDLPDQVSLLESLEGEVRCLGVI